MYEPATAKWDSSKRAAHRADITAGADDRARCRSSASTERRASSDRRRKRPSRSVRRIGWSISRCSNNRTSERRASRPDSRPRHRGFRTSNERRSRRHGRRRCEPRCSRATRSCSADRSRCRSTARCQEHDQRQQRERHEIDLQAAVFKHRGRVDGLARETSPIQAASLTRWCERLVRARPCPTSYPYRTVCGCCRPAFHAAESSLPKDELFRLATRHTSIVFGHALSRRLL